MADARYVSLSGGPTVSGFTIRNGHALDVATQGGGGGVLIYTSGTMVIVR